MSNFSQILSGIEAVVQSALGSTYVRLDHIVRIDQNRFNSESKRWGVRAAPSKEVAGNTHNNTIDYSFVLTLTDGYITDNCDDHDVLQKMTDLIGLVETVYVALIQQKAGAASVSRLVSGLNIDDIMVLNKDKIVIVESSFFVRTQISF